MPKIPVQCKECETKYTAGDFLPPSKSKCPNCGTTGNRPTYITLGGGLKCFKCNKLYTKSEFKKCPECNGILVPQR